MLFCDDDDLVVIALWIIAIGFIILAIDKTTKLNNGAAMNGTNCMPPVPTPTQSQLTTTTNTSNTSGDDEQFKQIQIQLQQLKNGISELKEKSKGH